MTEPTMPRAFTAPTVIEVRRDAVHREIRLELADWRTRTGGVYDLSPTEQEALLLDGHLPGWGLFLPDFVIVYATGEPVRVEAADGTLVGSVAWTDLRLHVGGVVRDAIGNPERRRSNGMSASAEWHSLDAILGRTPRKDAAPNWLLDLIRADTPWGFLLDCPGTGARDA